MILPLWRRRHPPRAHRTATFSWFVFSRGDRARGPVSAARFGLPEGGLYGVEVRRHRREEDPAWFDRFRGGALRASAEAHLGDLRALDAADTCHHVHVACPDPPHLGHLQAGMALVRWLLAGGGEVALDGMAARFWAGVPVPSAQLALRDHVSLLVETAPTLGEDGHLLHTRGLRSFGRPDLVTVARPTDVDALGPVLLQLAAALAEGWMPDGPTDVDLGTAGSVSLHPDPGLPFVTRLGLDNDALIVTDAAGEALVGFAERSRA